MGSVVNLRKLFANRDKNYSDLTNSIYQSIPVAFVALEEYIGKEAYSKIDMRDIQLVDDVVVIAGISLPPIGELINVDGVDFEVNEQNQEMFGRLIKIGIPIPLAAEGTKEEIIEFLKRADEMFESRQNRNVLESLDNVHVVESEEDLADVLENVLNQSKKRIPVVGEPDFNMDELSEEQIQQLMLHEKKDDEDIQH